MSAERLACSKPSANGGCSVSQIQDYLWIFKDSFIKNWHLVLKMNFKRLWEAHLTFQSTLSLHFPKEEKMCNPHTFSYSPRDSGLVSQRPLNTQEEKSQWGMLRWPSPGKLKWDVFLDSAAWGFGTACGMERVIIIIFWVITDKHKKNMWNMKYFTENIIDFDVELPSR